MPTLIDELLHPTSSSIDLHEAWKSSARPLTEGSFVVGPARDFFERSRNVNRLLDHDTFFAPSGFEKLRASLQSANLDAIAGKSLPSEPVEESLEEHVGPVTSFDQALYLLSKGWKPGA